MGNVKDGIQLIAEERKRQAEKGYHQKHLSMHSVDGLIEAAVAYASMAYLGLEFDFDDEEEKARFKSTFEHALPSGWEYEPASDVQDLVMAGALIAAAIDRLNSKLTVETS